MTITFRRCVALVAGAVLLSACGEESSPSNVVPTAAFSAQCTALGCAFTNGSTDPDGTVESYAWDFGDGSALAATRDASHTYAGAGRFTVTLTVTDDDGETSTASRTVDVRAPVAPVNPTTEIQIACNYLSCTFSTLSTGRVVVAWEWSFGDGSTSEEEGPTHTYAAAGTYLVRVTITDAELETATILYQLTVLSPPPPATFTSDCSGITCTFTNTTDTSAGVFAGAQWDFGDGSISTDWSPWHVYQVTERTTFTVTLRVYDWDMGGSSTSAEVVVEP